MANHASPQQIERYHRRSLTPPELLSVSDHLAACPACRRQLAALQPVRAAADRLLAELAVSAAAAGHLDPDTLDRLVDGTLDPVGREIAESHLSICAACEAEVADLRVFAAELAARPAEMASPAGSRRGRPLPGVRWAVGSVAASLLVLAWLVAPRPQGPRQTSTRPSAAPSAIAPSAVSPVHASPQPDHLRVLELPRRAAAPVTVAVTPQTRWLQVEVAVDSNALSFDASVQDHRRGKVVWRDEEIPAPSAGKPLVLRLPASILALGDLLLFVRGQTLRGKESSVQEYALRVIRLDASATATASPR